MGEMVVGKISFGQSSGRHPGDIDIFGRNKLTFENYKVKQLHPFHDVHIPKEWARQILEMFDICSGTSMISLENKSMFRWIFDKYPILKNEFPGLLED